MCGHVLDRKSLESLEEPSQKRLDVFAVAAALVDVVAALTLRAASDALFQPYGGQGFEIPIIEGPIHLPLLPEALRDVLG